MGVRDVPEATQEAEDGQDEQQCHCPERRPPSESSAEQGRAGTPAMAAIVVSAELRAENSSELSCGKVSHEFRTSLFPGHTQNQP